jgi:hypothetical protein
LETEINFLQQRFDVGAAKWARQVAGQTKSTLLRATADYLY